MPNAGTLARDGAPNDVQNAERADAIGPWGVRRVVPLHLAFPRTRAKLLRSTLQGCFIKTSRRTGFFPVILLVGVGSATLPPDTAYAQAAKATAATTYPGRYPWTQADADFVTGMISHHAQAIIMANWAPTHGASRSVATLCARIVNSQTDEIHIMQDWLKTRGLPVPEAKPLPMKMKMNGVEMMMLMPGMLSEEQLKELEAAQGTEFDRLFLTYMIQHHQGAITMVEELNRNPGAGQDDTVFKMSSDIFADQSAEIERMDNMLSQIPTR